ncbi:hypothetical protein [Lapidilactobacillus gannanensis]|uniref:hypothetical protein n=1 Tax=Lapidilactobacillus gannanensis TaxID=2486002 RepID=UPI0036D3D878
MRKKTTFYYRSDNQNWPLLLAEPQTEPQACLLLTTTTGNKTLHQWELLFLLKQPDYYQLPIYVYHDGKQYPIFGFRMVNQQAWLH